MINMILKTSRPKVARNDDANLLMSLCIMLSSNFSHWKIEEIFLAKNFALLVRQRSSLVYSKLGTVRRFYRENGTGRLGTEEIKLEGFEFLLEWMDGAKREWQTLRQHTKPNSWVLSQRSLGAFPQLPRAPNEDRQNPRPHLKPELDMASRLLLCPQLTGFLFSPP